MSAPPDRVSGDALAPGELAARRARIQRRAAASASAAAPNAAPQTHSLRLPNLQVIEYTAPASFHLPRVLASDGLKGYEVHSIAAALALVEMSTGAFFDVGANIGVFALSVASALQRRCYAFEPFPDARAVLEDIVLRYSFPVSVRPEAMSEAEGQSQFFLSMRSDMSNSLDPDFRQHRGVLDVSLTTIDKAARNDVPGVIKIDTERAEVAVIKGSLNTLKAHSPALIIEVLEPNIGIELLDLLVPLGYLAYEISGAPTFSRVSQNNPPATSADRNWVFSRAPLDKEFMNLLNKWRGLLCAL
jgi:FkbM family methyltransferase